MNILFLGPQGAGKGTQAKRISEAYAVPQIATGDMLRDAMAAGTELGRRVKPIYDSGQLVPDDLMIELVRERLARPDARDGFILDGFPRTIAQAEALDEMLAEIGRPLDVVLELQLDDAVATQRMLKRAAEEGRTDDTPDAIRKRLALYHELTEPLVAHYLPTGKVVGIHGDRSADDVYAEIQEALEQVRAPA